MDNPQELSARQTRVIPFLITHNVVDACRLAKVSRKAVWCWEKEPAFQEALRAAREGAFESALGRVKANIDLAVGVLVKLTEAGEKEETRLKAAAIVLERAIEIRRLESVESRLSLLEQALGGRR